MKHNITLLLIMRKSSSKWKKCVIFFCTISFVLQIKYCFKYIVKYNLKHVGRVIYKKKNVKKNHADND